APTGLAAEVVADAVGLPLAAVWPAEPGLAAAGDHGEPPGQRPGAPLARVCGSLLAGVLGPAPVAVA
ncbi:MAG: septum formation initiator, partial [Actinomycetota bacterium]